MKYSDEDHDKKLLAALKPKQDLDSVIEEKIESMKEKKKIDEPKIEDTSEFLPPVHWGSFSLAAMASSCNCDYCKISRNKNPENSIESKEETLREEVKEWLVNINPKICLDDVIGNKKAKEALIEAIIDPIEHAELYEAYNNFPSKGILLYSPPGCGKTMLAKAIVSELFKRNKLGPGMILVKGPSLESPYVGETERHIRSLFEYARAYYARYKIQLIIFIDEADSILMSRRGNISQYAISNVSTFLAEMDGLETNSAFVILATNRPQAIDEAILRDGRINRRIEIERPTLSDVQSLLLKLYSNYYDFIIKNAKFLQK